MSEQIFFKAASPVDEAGELLAADLGNSGRCDLGHAHVAADRLRDILLGLTRQSGGTARRFHIARAVVTGVLDLNGVQLTAPISFEDVHFAGPSSGAGEAARATVLSLVDADLAGLALRGSRIDGDVVADGLAVAADLVLDQVRIGGRFVTDAARIGGGFCLSGCRIGDDSHTTRGPAKAPVAAVFSGRGLFVGSGVLFDGAEAAGRIDLAGARFAQGISAVRIVVATTDPSEPALDLSRASIGGGLDLTQATVRGRLVLDDAQVAGTLTLDSVMCIDEGAGVSGRRLHIEGGLDGHEATLSGPVDFSGLTARRSVRFVRSALGEGGNVDGIALNLTAARLGEQLQVVASKCVGTMRFDEAVVARDFALAGTRVFGGETALSGHHLTVGGDIDLTGAFLFGRIAFADAVVGRDLALSGASLKVDVNEAFSAPRIRVGRDALINDGLRASGGVILEQAQIGGDCDFRNAEITSARISRGGRGAHAMRHAVSAGPVASVAGGTAGAQRRAFSCEPDICAIGLHDAGAGTLMFGAVEDQRPRGVVDLTQASVSRLRDNAAAWPPPREKRMRDDAGRDIDHWKLDGFCYRRLESPLGLEGGAGPAEGIANQRLRWLDGQSADDLSVNLCLQPFDQLESVLSMQGLDCPAREVALARARLVAQSQQSSPGQRFASICWDLLTGHGLRPWRTVGWLALAWMAMAFLAGWAASQCALPGCRDESAFVMVRRDGYDPARLDSAYPAFDPLLYAADVVVPLVETGMREHWRPNPAFREIATVPAILSSPGSGVDHAQQSSLTTGWLLALASRLFGLAGAALSVLALLGFFGVLKPRRGT